MKPLLLLLFIALCGACSSPSEEVTPRDPHARTVQQLGDPRCTAAECYCSEALRRRGRCDVIFVTKSSLKPHNDGAYALWGSVTLRGAYTPVVPVPILQHGYDPNPDVGYTVRFHLGEIHSRWREQFRAPARFFFHPLATMFYGYRLGQPGESNERLQMDVRGDIREDFPQSVTATYIQEDGTERVLAAYYVAWDQDTNHFGTTEVALHAQFGTVTIMDLGTLQLWGPSAVDPLRGATFLDEHPTWERLY